MNLRKFTGKLHLWLGLSSGLVVFIISVTGCLYAFQEEIGNLTQPYRFAKATDKPLLIPTQIKSIAEQQLPGKHAHSVLYEKNDKAAQVIFYNADPAYYYSVYIDPRTGEVLKVKDMNMDFFRIVLMGHFYLWLPPSVGQPVAATGTLIFVIMLITGLIMWWPRNRNGAKQRFSIKWDAKWRRKNYDMHNVLGFYICGLALILALTGLVWGFEWFAKSVYWTTSGGKKMTNYYEPPSDTTIQKNTSENITDRLWARLQPMYNTVQSMEIHFPESRTSSIAVNVNPEEGVYYKRDILYFDQYTMKELEVDHVYGKYSKAGIADKLIRMNYDIHVGGILGLPGKILAFGISLVSASLPVTGCIIWYGRKKKKPVVRKEIPVPVTF